jgi:DNA-binding CsgD family transcriptional regulator
MNSHHLDLEQVIEFVQATEKNSLHQICDTNLRFKFVGEKLANRFGYTANEVLNKNLSELDTPVTHLCTEYRDIHQNIIRQPNYHLNYLTIIPELNYTIIQNQVIVLMNDNIFNGLYIKSREINSLNTFIAIKDFINNSGNNQAKIINLTKHSYNNTLSEKEELILYLIIFGKFDKEIAEILSKIYCCTISRDGITKCVTRRLYTEFNVVNRSELIMAAYKSGISSHLPKLLIQFNSIL